MMYFKNNDIAYLKIFQIYENTGKTMVQVVSAGGRNCEGGP